MFYEIDVFKIFLVFASLLHVGLSESNSDSDNSASICANFVSEFRYNKGMDNVSENMTVHCRIFRDVESKSNESITCIFPMNKNCKSELDNISGEFGHVITRVIHIENSVSSSKQEQREEFQNMFNKLSQIEKEYRSNMRTLQNTITLLKEEVQTLNLQIKVLKDDMKEQNVDNPKMVQQIRNPIEGVSDIIKQRVQRIFGQSQK